MSQRAVSTLWPTDAPSLKVELPTPPIAAHHSLHAHTIPRAVVQLTWNVHCTRVHQVVSRQLDRQPLQTLITRVHIGGVRFILGLAPAQCRGVVVADLSTADQQTQVS